jgi:hypothetical protein
MKVMTVVLLVLLVGTFSDDQDASDLKEVVELVSAERSGLAGRELGEVVRFLRVAPHCSVNETTWIRAGRPVLRLEEEYFPRAASHHWRLKDMASDWTLKYDEVMPGFEFDSLSSARDLVDRFVKLSEASRPIRYELRLSAGGAEALTIAVEGSEVEDSGPLHVLVAEAERSGRSSGWKRAIPPALLEELRALRSVACDSAATAGCASEPLYDLLEALFGVPSGASEWTTRERSFHRELSAGILKLGFEPFVGSHCNQGAEDAGGD